MSKEEYKAKLSLVVNATNEETHLIVGLIDMLKGHTFQGKEEALRQLRYVVEWLERELDGEELDNTIQAMRLEEKP
jgi:hypothetical protein